MRVNGVFAIFSDGEDTESKSLLKSAIANIEEFNKKKLQLLLFHLELMLYELLKI